ncbi:hypothetical protein BKA60DRAFT_529079 [Fusarium oxysporum]|uniref:SnoaL-like domain-containing protein n=1 Tax=Fusarium oxysporum TaxID=5507 RepID=A0A420MCW9_FUSOX|nr:hypothetical protein BKA60DRAFT_529079 [Fusarium oxysporum]RKK65936.1 hypothetical protein BFJ69_g15849 [Fusarium oxysporum]
MPITDDALRNEVDQVYNDLKDQPQHTPSQIATVKRIIKLHLVAFKYYDFAQTRHLVDKNYKQHSAFVGDGQESIIDMAKTMREWAAKNWARSDEPHIRMNIKRILVDDPYVTVHHHSRRWDGDIGNNVIDIYRVKDGKVAEHWESVMDVVPESELKHGNGQF